MSRDKKKDDLHEKNNNFTSATNRLALSNTVALAVACTESVSVYSISLVSLNKAKLHKRVNTDNKR